MQRLPSLLVSLINCHKCWASGFSNGRSLVTFSLIIGRVQWSDVVTSPVSYLLTFRFFFSDNLWFINSIVFTHTMLMRNFLWTYKNRCLILWNEFAKTLNLSFSSNDLRSLFRTAALMSWLVGSAYLIQRSTGLTSSTVYYQQSSMR